MQGCTVHPRTPRSYLRIHGFTTDTRSL